jgi:hypothetical protein
MVYIADFVMERRKTDFSGIEYIFLPLAQSRADGIPAVGRYIRHVKRVSEEDSKNTISKK